MTSAPITFTWSGDAMEPMSRFRALCDRKFVVGQIYALVEHQDRSTITHNHEFAWLAEAWKNLPENVADMFPTPEHLRKRALIDAGFYDEQIVDAGSQAAALRVAATFRSREEFSLVITRGPVVVLRTAKSQSRRSMGAKEFQASKSAILEIVSGMIGVAPAELQQNTGRAA